MVDSEDTIEVDIDNVKQVAGEKHYRSVVQFFEIASATTTTIAATVFASTVSFSELFSERLHSITQLTSGVTAAVAGGVFLVRRRAKNRIHTLFNELCAHRSRARMVMSKAIERHPNFENEIREIASNRNISLPGR